MKIKGIKRGQTIQLLQQLDTINNGQEVFLRERHADYGREIASFDD